MMLQVTTFETRAKQLEHARKYVAEKTAKAGDKDLIIFAGDFNAAGPTGIKEAKNY